MPIFKTSKARENILRRIRAGLLEPVPAPYPEHEKETHQVYAATIVSAEEQFAMEFSKLGGKFVFCADETELVQTILKLHQVRGWEQMLCTEPMLEQAINRHMDIAVPATSLPEDADACITGCELLLARTGSILFTSSQNLGRTSTVYYPVHIVVAYLNQVVSDIDEAFVLLKKRHKGVLPSMVNLTTGPSRTADIEKTLVVGVHGPAEIFCMLVGEEKELD